MKIAGFSRGLRHDENRAFEARAQMISISSLDSEKVPFLDRGVVGVRQNEFSRGVWF